MAGLGASFSMENNNEFFFTAARTMLEATSRCFSSLVKKMLQRAHTSPDPESPSAEVNAYVTAPSGMLGRPGRGSSRRTGTRHTYPSAPVSCSRAQLQDSRTTRITPVCFAFFLGIFRVCSTLCSPSR